MKYLNKLFLVVLIFAGIGCSDLTNLDINQNPNSPSPDQAEAGFLFNQVQLGFNSFFEGTQDATATASRQRTRVAFFYNTAYTPEGLDFLWTRAYANFLQDALTLEQLAADSGANTGKAGATKVMRSYVMTSLVDMFGDVPMSDAFQGTDAISPTKDDDEAVYASAEALLDEAIELLSSENASVGDEDLFYEGSAASWITLANTLKLRIYSNTRGADSGAGAKMKAIIDGDDFIDEASEDFQFQYSNNRANPDSRHPFYVSDYEASDGGYMSNYYMWLLVGDKEVADPRTRFYFYRQQSAFSEASIDPNEWDCVVTNTPFDEIPPGAIDHITSVDPNLPFCVASLNGYFGRDHGNGSGIPPDGPLRTEYGVYPGGGSYDNNSFSFTQTDGTLGSQGAGISPLWLSSFTDFIRAEAALEASTGEDAKALLLSAVEKSINKVAGFTSIVPSVDLERVIGQNPDTGEDIFATSLLPTAEDITAYVDAVSARYDAASDKLDVIMTEYHIALFGNGLESYNMYRRTGKPNNMQPLLDAGAAASSEFPRLFLYPNNYVTRNANADQREFTEQVFWDVLPAGALR